MKFIKPYMTIIICCFIVVLLTVSPYAASTDALAKLDATGNQLLHLSRRIGYWIVTIVALYKVIQCALKGSKKEIGEVIITYILIYGSMFLIPWAMKLVENVF